MVDSSPSGAIMVPNYIRGLVEHQALLSEQIKSAVEDLHRGGRENITSRRIDARLSALHQDWNDFGGNHKTLISDVAELSEEVAAEVKLIPYFAQSVFRTVREQFLDAFEKMTCLLDEIPSTSSSKEPLPKPQTQLNPSFSHRLPRLDLPKFSGDYTDWLTFRDMFSSLVLKNDSLSPVEKLHYLKSSLSGSAALLLKHTPLTDANFQLAWNDLTSYYDNNRILVDATLHSLFSMKCIHNESATELEELYSTLQQKIRSLQILDQPVQHWDSILIYLTTRCLDSNTVRAWELELGASTEYPKWSQMSDFLMKRIRSLHALDRSSSFKLTSQSQSRVKAQAPHSVVRQFNSHSVQPTNSFNPVIKVCPLCEDNHFINRCPDYNSKTLERKLDVIKQKSLCYNCLGSHSMKLCPSLRRCFKCGKKHHTSIHAPDSRATNDHPVATLSLQSTSKSGSEQEDRHVFHHTLSIPPFRTSVLLATARAKVDLGHGQLIDVRILIDPGSETSLVTERLVQMHHIPRHKSHASIVGGGELPIGQSKGSVILKLKSNYEPEYDCFMTAEILPKLTGNTPSTQITSQPWEHLNGIHLADPQFFDPSSVDIIIGSDHYHQIIQPGLKKGKPGDPIAQLTKFGWILSGPVGHTLSSIPIQSYHCTCDKNGNELLEKFWRQEEVTKLERSLSPADEECERIFKSTHQRTDSGKYIVRLPFNSPATSFCESRSVALRSLNRLYRRFESGQLSFLEYHNFLTDYEDLEHMKRVQPQTPEPMPVNYLPHHGVISHSSTNPKLRVVFDGSSKCSDGKSINDFLHTGEKLQADLSDVLCWFRKFKIVFSTDIAKMYRQIMIHPDDWRFQRILWKDSAGELIEYNLTTVTYGLACSPFLALRTVNQLIEDEGDKFPSAVPILTKGRYVDDIFGGGDTIEEVDHCIQQVTQLCMAGGFPLRKWISNNPTVLSSIPSDHQLKGNSIPLDKPWSTSTLGILWNPIEDVFTFPSGISPAAPFTKRSISSKIASLFDPVGFIAPVTIKAKILLQKLWGIRVGWDEPVPDNIAQQWMEFNQQLADLQYLQFPRWIGITNNCTYQLHGFSDASLTGLAAVVYIKVTIGGHSTVAFVCAKTKVTPLKRLTIPRLELSAATLLTRLTAHVNRSLDLAHSPIFLWTDSSIVHTWVTNHPSKWKEYVHNRVCFIQETLPSAQWKFVPGHTNPADCASRGLSPKELSTDPNWLHGPSWLASEPVHWPNSIPLKPQEDALETKTTVTVAVTRTDNHQVWDLLERFSSLTRLLRITAICQRIIKKFRHRFDGSILIPLTPEELTQAKYFWVRLIQLNAYPKEFATLSAKENLSKTNPLIRLTPFIDNKGILRVGGRLNNSLLSYDNKHPFILPRDSSLSKLIISDAHSRTLHGSTQSTLAYIRTTCWILGGRAPVRSFILRCVKCSILRRNAAQQLMGQLPFTRVTPVERPFIHTGIDYAGPVIVKTWSGRAAKTYKAYIALFVCHSTSAIHLELVTDYTTEAFLAAYKRFVSRRGICQTLSSDCGTNLKGADAELKKLFSAASAELCQLASLIANDGTKWRFNPPAAPHFGGKWEAGVKSVKHHLRRIVGDTLLTYEEMATVLAQIEAILNSRPLCPLTDDPDDLSVLTPGHFLIGHPLNAIPEPSLEGVKSNRLTRWQRSRQMMETFWNRWSHECLQRYQAIYKWNQSSNPISLGTIVLIMDERYPPTKWPLGRVVQVHPGKDGLVRVATIKTQTNTVTRPIVKLCPLPIPTNSE